MNEQEQEATTTRHKNPAVEVIAKAFAEAWNEHPKNTEADAHIAVSALTQAGYAIVPDPNRMGRNG